MVDIIDVILAKALTPQGEIETYAKRAQKAAEDAVTAENSAQSIIDSFDEIREQVTEDSATAAETVQTVNAALEDVETALAEIQSVDKNTINNEVDKLILSLESVSNNDAITYNLTTTYPSEKVATINNLIKLYTSLGDNIDGTMTQKAITDAINNIPSGGGGGSTNLGSENAGKMVVVGDSGVIQPSRVTEDQLIDLIVSSDNYNERNTIGLSIDYQNRAFTRTQEAQTLSAGNDFNKYSMYGGRMRCNVADNGQILAFYGDYNYREDGSNGQVMVYQPKFYYHRTIIDTQNNTLGKIINKETLIISPENKPGFKLHPLFINEEGEEVEYVLLPAYDGSIYDYSSQSYITSDSIQIDFDYDKLSSVANSKPISGDINELTVLSAEKLASNHGNGWHITTLQAESANQMLGMIEFGALNGQASIGPGVCGINSTAHNYASLTGSTFSLGNGTGSAASTTNEKNGTTTVETATNKVAISYRGMENPWGNIWRFVGNMLVSGNGSQMGGIPYICKNYNYSSDVFSENYESLNIILPNTQNWISAMGYGDQKYDWVYFPVKCEGASSALPVGDSLWTSTNLNGLNCVGIGGTASYNDQDGPFYYACDHVVNDHTGNYGAKLMFIPTKNSIYENNYATWVSITGG